MEVEVGNTEHSWPECVSCGSGSLLPLSDFGGQGASILYKAWACSNPVCGFNLKIRNGVMDGLPLTAAQVSALAALPPKEQLVANLLGQMNAPITGFVTVLNGPIRGLAMVLQRRAEQLAA